MANSRSLQKAVRFALATITASAGVATLHAQTAPAQPAEAAAAPLQEVVVTGSRLKTPNETAISPITTVSATDIQATGLTRVEDVLNNLPMVFAGMNSTTSNGADGTASVDLRGLGNQRTLVLVNGRRLGPGAPTGRNYSDINFVPTALIQRVDVETGGASAVYGADAVAGVVNFILNTHFEGVQVNAGYHFNEHNNNQTSISSIVSAAGFATPPSSVNTAYGKYGSVIAGSNFADNRGNATAYVTYDNQGAALQKNFDYSACNLAGSGTSLVCGGSSTSAGGRFEAFNTAGVRYINQTVDRSTGLMRAFSTATDLYNFAPLNYYQVPNERWTAGTFVNYEINSWATAYMDVMYMRNQSQAQIAESGDFGYPSFVACANPLLTAQEVSVLCSAANLAAQGNPFETYNGVNYPGLNMLILRRNVEGGPRVATFSTDAAREVIGLRGAFGDAWNYDIYAQHGTVDVANGNQNYLSVPNLQQAINALPGAGGTTVCGGPTGLIPPLVSTTGTAYAANKACSPWNLWVPSGGHAGSVVTPAALTFMSVPLLLQGDVTEQVVSGSITGDIGKYGVKLPTADDGLQLNVGAEYRSEASEFLPDALSQAGSAAGSGGPTPPVHGDFHVSEVFTEERLPLATHVPGAEDLSLEGGYRYSKYTEGFDTSTYKIGLEWSPVRDVRVRGSYQRAVRAPNINELYLPQTVGLDGSSDPCAAPLKAGSTTTLTTGATAAACALTGVTAAQFGNIGPNSANQYNGLQGGNPLLVPEKADTYSVGFQLTPRAVPNLSVSVDYFNIKIKNVIGPVGGDTILNNCIFGTAGQQATYCPLVHRDPTGSLWLTPAGYVTDVNQNQGALITKGIDIKGSYRAQLPAGIGSLLFGMEGTKLNSLATTPVAGGASYDCQGYFGSVCGAGDPSWRHVLNATWSTPWDALDVTLRWRYIGSVDSETTSSNTFLKGTPFVPLEHISAFNYVDLTAALNVYKNIRFTVGVNNIADKDPPLVVNGDCSTSSPAGANCNGNTFPGVYDAMGRYIFMQLQANF